jgi:hypothetical protein
VDAADTDDSGKVDITDPVYALNFLFVAGPEPPNPYPECGTENDMDDELECAASPECP